MNRPKRRTLAACIGVGAIGLAVLMLLAQHLPVVVKAVLFVLSIGCWVGVFALVKDEPRVSKHLLPFGGAIIAAVTLLGGLLAYATATAGTDDGDLKTPPADTSKPAPSDTSEPLTSGAFRSQLTGVTVTQGLTEEEMLGQMGLKTGKVYSPDNASANVMLVQARGDFYPKVSMTVEFLNQEVGELTSKGAVYASCYQTPHLFSCMVYACSCDVHVGDRFSVRVRLLASGTSGGSIPFSQFDSRAYTLKRNPPSSS